jgi:ketosteroid isomerase-like protein
MDREDAVRAAFAAVTSGDVDAMVALCTEDVEFGRPVSGAGDDDIFRGHDGVRRWMERVKDDWDELHVDLLDLRPAGRHMLVHARFRAQGRESGAEAPQIFWMASFFRGDRFCRWSYHATEAEAEAALSAQHR